MIVVIVIMGRAAMVADPLLARGFGRRQEQDMVVIFYSQIKVKDAKEKEDDGGGELAAWCYSDQGWGEVLVVERSIRFRHLPLQ